MGSMQNTRDACVSGKECQQEVEKQQVVERCYESQDYGCCGYGEMMMEGVGLIWVRC